MKNSRLTFLAAAVVAMAAVPFIASAGGSATYNGSGSHWNHNQGSQTNYSNLISLGNGWYKNPHPNMPGNSSGGGWNTGTSGNGSSGSTGGWHNGGGSNGGWNNTGNSGSGSSGGWHNGGWNTGSGNGNTGTGTGGYPTGSGHGWSGGGQGSGSAVIPGVWHLSSTGTPYYIGAYNPSMVPYAYAVTGHQY